MDTCNIYEDNLIKVLKDRGLYDAGMSVKEMEEVVELLQVSASEVPTDDDLERAIAESEQEYNTYSEQNALASSTMIAAPLAIANENIFESPPRAVNQFVHTNQSQCDCDSPPTAPIFLKHIAQVHHPLDWSPEERNVHKRRVADIECNDCDLKRVRRVEIHSAQPYADVTPVSIGQPGGDSGFSLEESASLPSISESSTIPSTYGEMPSRLLISTSSVAVSDMSHSDEDSNASHSR